MEGSVAERITPTDRFEVATGIGPRPVPCYLFQPAAAGVGTALILHGRNGAVAQPHIQTLVTAYLARGWTVAAPDLPHSSASPELGAAEDVTLEGHARAATAVLGALRDTGREDAPIGICGHSLGAYAAAIVAASARPHHLLAVSPVVSGAALLAARRALGPAAEEELAREAPRLHVTMETETAIPALQRLEAPVAVMTGARDGLTPPADARAYFDAAPGAAFFAVLRDQHHCPTGPVVECALDAAFDAIGA